MELTVAMSLLVILGGGLVTLLGQGVRIWNTAENRGKAYEEARAVLDRVAEDLRSVVARNHSTDGDDWVRFISDADPQGRQRLRFVRTVSGEAADPLLREGGRFLSVRTPAVCDGKNDAEEAAQGLLAAPGGLQEILYAADPRPGGRSVWRGSRSPVGGADSLFVDENLEPRPTPRDVKKSAPVAKTDDPTAAPVGLAEAVAVYDGPLARVAAPIADNVLFLGFSFWTPRTNTWLPTPTLKDPKGGQPSGPTPWWDSTRGLLDLPGSAGEFVWARKAGSLDDPRDDVFPELVEITVVVNDRNEPLGAMLSEDMNEAAKSIPLTREVELPEDPRDRFVLVDDEWIEIESATGAQLEVKAQGRGARFTKPARHDRGARVVVGLTFRRVIEVPGFRAEEREAGGRRAKRGAKR